MISPKNILALDIGGTSIHAALVAAAGALTELPSASVDSSDGASADAIIDSFAEVIRGAQGQVDGVGICIPGPFDYRRGISLMTHKFPSLHGVDVRKTLMDAVPWLRNVPVAFCHDANAFLLGEMSHGAAQGATRAGGVTLGTGIGVACCLDGKLLVNDLGSPADDVSVWSKPYRNGCVEDCVSSRAIVAAYRSCRPDFDPAGGAKGVADAAKVGDADAVRVYAEFGADLGTVLCPWCERFQPEVLVFGGQIARDFALFESSLRKALGAECVRLSPSCLGTAAALYGAAANTTAESAR